MALVYLGLGSNLGRKDEFLELAIVEIEKQIGLIVARSAFYNYAPWGFESPNSFKNACVAVETTLDPQACLRITSSVESILGRVRQATDGYKDRVIDIDLLFYDQLVLNDENLTIPHPLAHHRRFVLEPLAEISPKLMHPVLHKNIETLLKELI